MSPGRFVADNSSELALATRMRRARFRILEGLIRSLVPPVRILDVGGTEVYWRMMGLQATADVEVVLLNTERASPSLPGFSSVQGDARALSGIGDGEFDIVFSNSVIEHVGGIDDQRRMANEVRRVGRMYCVQTPNRHFPIEPHFLFPFFQFLPVEARIWLVRRFSLGWFKAAPDEMRARELVTGIRLLTRREVQALFPEAVLFDEKVLGLVKSFVAYTPVRSSRTSPASNPRSGEVAGGPEPAA